MGKSKKARQPDTAPQQAPKVVCFFCDGEFADQGVLILHQQSKHFKCSDCSGFHGGRCPTHGCKHKCLVTLSCHWKKDHNGEVKTIPGAKEGRDDPKKFWHIHGVNGVPEDFEAVRHSADAAPFLSATAIGVPVPESELPPMPDQPPLPPMCFPDLFAEGTPAIPGLLPMAPLPGDAAVGGAGHDDSLPPSSGGAEPQDFAAQVAAFMAIKEAADEVERKAAQAAQEQAAQEQAAIQAAIASSAILSAASSSAASKSEPPPTPAIRQTTPAVTEYVTYADMSSVWTIQDNAKSMQQEPSGYETMPNQEQWKPTGSSRGSETMPPKSQEWSSRSTDGQDRDKRSRSRDRDRDRSDRARRSRSRDRRERQEQHTRDDRGRNRSRERGRDGSAGGRDANAGARDWNAGGRDGNAGGKAGGNAGGNAGRSCAIAITQGNIPSRIFLQGLMGPYGRLEYSHTGNRLNPERDPPWVLFATSGSAEDAMKAIVAGMIVDGQGVPIRAEWKTVTGKGKGGKGKGKSKTDQMDLSSRDLYRKGARDERR